jgi:hypothetical protein
MIKSVLTDVRDKRALLIKEMEDGNCVLVVDQYAHTNSAFYTASSTKKSTVRVITPKISAGLVLTDLIITYGKVGGGVITVQFNDGINSIVVFTAASTDAPIAIAIPLAGKFAGWTNAWLEMITTQDETASVTAGFYRTKPEFTLSYTEWLEDRTG